jgi:hypothetical protein
MASSRQVLASSALIGAVLLERTVGVVSAHKVVPTNASAKTVPTVPMTIFIVHLSLPPMVRWRGYGGAHRAALETRIYVRTRAMYNSPKGSIVPKGGPPRSVEHGLQWLEGIVPKRLGSYIVTAE